MSNSDPIGVFDSGIGGISVLRRIREALPNENLLYIADTGHNPYGDKPKAFIEKRCIALTEFLLKNKAKAIVVACNTATAAAIATIRDLFSIPIIGIEPGIKPAISMTKTGVVGILATKETLKSQKFENLAARFCNECKLAVQECSGLVEQVEKADLSGEKTRQLVEKFVHPLIARGADTIVLGCTHYPLLLDLFKDAAGKGINIIDTGIAVANEVRRRIAEARLLTCNEKPDFERFWTSGDREKMQELMDFLWNRPVEVHQLPDGV